MKKGRFIKPDSTKKVVGNGRMIKKVTFIKKKKTDRLT